MPSVGISSYQEFRVCSNPKCRFKRTFAHKWQCYKCKEPFSKAWWGDDKRDNGNLASKEQGRESCKNSEKQDNKKENHRNETLRSVLRDFLDQPELVAAAKAALETAQQERLQAKPTWQLLQTAQTKLEKTKKQVENSKAGIQKCDEDMVKLMAKKVEEEAQLAKRQQDVVRLEAELAAARAVQSGPGKALLAALPRPDDDDPDEIKQLYESARASVEQFGTIVAQFKAAKTAKASSDAVAKTPAQGSQELQAMAVDSHGTPSVGAGNGCTANLAEVPCAAADQLQKYQEFIRSLLVNDPQLALPEELAAEINAGADQKLAPQSRGRQQRSRSPRGATSDIP